MCGHLKQASKHNLLGKNKINKRLLYKGDRKPSLAGWKGEKEIHSWLSINFNQGGGGPESSLHLLYYLVPNIWSNEGYLNKFPYRKFQMPLSSCWSKKWQDPRSRNPQRRHSPNNCMNSSSVGFAKVLAERGQPSSFVDNLSSPRAEKSIFTSVSSCPLSEQIYVRTYSTEAWLGTRYPRQS